MNDKKLVAFAKVDTVLSSVFLITVTVKGNCRFELSKSISAGELLAEIGPIIGVKGGGPAHLARGGGAGDLEKFEEAIDRAKDWVRERL